VLGDSRHVAGIVPVDQDGCQVRSLQPVKKGDTVKYAVPESDMERSQRFMVLDELEGLEPGAAVHLEQLGTGLAMPIILTVHLRDIVPAE